MKSNIELNYEAFSGKLTKNSWSTEEIYFMCTVVLTVLLDPSV
jgi:hypothetical protein